MGFNSTVLILNDRLSEIEREPERFVKEMVYGIHLSGRPEDQVDFSPGQSIVMSCEHADRVTILAVGGNCATIMGKFHNGGHHHTKGDQESLLKMLADEYGFRLVRKPKKRR